MHPPPHMTCILLLMCMQSSHTVIVPSRVNQRPKSKCVRTTSRSLLLLNRSLFQLNRSLLYITVLLVGLYCSLIGLYCSLIVCSHAATNAYKANVCEQQMLTRRRLVLGLMVCGGGCEGVCVSVCCVCHMTCILLLMCVACVRSGYTSK